MSSPFGNLTDKTNEALQLAQSEVIQRRHALIEPAHILFALMSQEGGVASALFRRANKDEKGLQSALAGVLACLPKLSQPPTQPGLSSEAHDVLLKAKEEAAAMKDVTVYHAGTSTREDGALLSKGGRVLAITARGATIAEAQARAYEAVKAIEWPGGFYRKDIGWRAIAKTR